MVDVTYQQVVNQMSALVNSWQAYIDQQTQLDNGVATYVAPGPVGGVAQPSPGYYPITQPNGTTVWRPCIDLIRVQASAFVIKPAGAGQVAQTAIAADSGKCILLANTGGTTNVTVSFPAGLPVGWNAIYVNYGGQANMTFQIVAGSGVLLRQDQGLALMRSRYSLATAIVVANNEIVVQGSLR